MNSNLLSWNEKEWAYEQWCNGRTQTEIAEALHCSVKTITRALHGRPKIKPVLHYRKEGKCMDKDNSDLKWAYQIGDRIHYHSFGDLRRSALVLSSVGYGVAVIGLDGLHDNILTIMALPERKENI